ncbi:MAG: glycosyltransferase [Cyanobacteria bacterium P01_E01_bin.35]
MIKKALNISRHYITTTMSLELPTVSIIVSAYHGIRYLPATLNSILQQTCTNFEVLVFSNDYGQTVRWCQGRQDSRFKFFFPDNLGIAQTLNQGILQATGKYVSWINAGDLWHPTKLQKQLACLDHNPEVGFVHSWLMLIEHQGKSTGKIVKPEYSSAIDSLIKESNQICSISLMIRRSCFDVIGLFDTKLKAIPDWDLWLRLNHRYQSRKITEPLVYWRKNQRQLLENWLILEIDLQTTIEKAFKNVPADLLADKCRSYGYASLFLARTVLCHKEPDSAIANNYCQQALAHYPTIGLSFTFLQVRLGIIALSWLKSDRYLRLVSLIQRTELILREISQQLREYSHRLLDWMLEEEDILIWGKNSKIKRQSKD